jgi:hypothetical protein
MTQSEREWEARAHDGLQAYSAYKLSAVPWLGVTPQHWEEGDDEPPAG